MVLLVALILTSLFMAPGARTQYPYPYYPYPAVPTPALTGPTVRDSVRNAVAATSTQAGVARQFADDWGRRAVWASYTDSQFQFDYGNMLGHFQTLRNQFNAVASLAAQLGQARSDNAVAELDAGLNVIAELFTFLQTQYNAGTLDNKTVVRTSRSFENALREWDKELKRNRSRLGGM